MNYKLLFLFIFLSGIIFINSYGQETNSRNLIDEYCKNNWKVDPVRCSAYVPKNYQSSQSQVTPQNNVQPNTVNDANRICPYGSHLGSINFGQEVCLDSITNKIVSYPNVAQSTSGSGSNGTAVGVAVFIIILLIIIVGIVKSRGKPKTVEYKDIPRKGFTNNTKEMIKEQQNGRCAICSKIPTHWEFDHINGRGDNSLRNCQGLCRDCHQDKTLKDHY